jgi:ribonuclease BN (tRNA processing enzyme)
VVEHGDAVIWCEAGPGTFVELWDRFELTRISAVVVSHEHPDHCLDLLAAYHAIAHGPVVRGSIPVFCPSSVIDRVRGFVRAAVAHPIDGVFEFEAVVGGDATTVEGIEMAFFDADHSVPTVASRYRTEHRTLAYSADTGPAPGGGVDAWHEVARDADLFLCEATFQGVEGTHEYTQHLTAAGAGAIAREMGAKRLMLTHIPHHLDASVSVHEAEITYDRAVALAVPGTTHDL